MATFFWSLMPSFAPLTVATESDIVAEYLAISMHKNSFWRVFDYWHICAGDEPFLASTTAFVDRLYAGSFFLLFVFGSLSGEKGRQTYGSGPPAFVPRAAFTAWASHIRDDDHLF